MGWLLSPSDDLLFRKLVLELLVEDLLEQLAEAAVVLLEDGVLGGEVERVLPGEGVLERAVGEGADALVGVELSLGDTGALELVDGVLDLLAGRAGPADLELAGTRDDEVHSLVLVGVGVTTDDDGLLPAGHQPGNVLADDGLAEHGAAEDVTDGAVGRLPDQLQLEISFSLIRSQIILVISSPRTSTTGPTLIVAAMVAEDALKHLTSRKVGAADWQREASSAKLKRPDEKDDEATMALRAGKCSRGALRARPAKPDRQQNWRGPAIATTSS